MLFTKADFDDKGWGMVGTCATTLEAGPVCDAILASKEGMRDQDFALVRQADRPKDHRSFFSLYLSPAKYPLGGIKEVVGVDLVKVTGQVQNVWKEIKDGLAARLPTDEFRWIVS